MHKNILTVVGITILFLGTLITPSVAIIEKSVEEKTNLEYPRFVSSNISIDKKTIITDDVIFEQLPFEPEESWVFRTSDANLGYRVWDEFWEINETICCIRWWGLSLIDSDNWTSCNPEGMVFEIIFWDALLGNPVCTYQVAPKAKGTFEFYNGSKMFYREVGLVPCCDCEPDGWVSIQSIQSPNQRHFLWAGSDDGDLYSYQEGASNPDCDSDCAYELGVVGCYYGDAKIQCEPVGMNFEKVRPRTNVTGQIYVYNKGPFLTWLEWFVYTANVPAWGTWTFSPASGGVGEDDCDIINVTCVLTDVTGTYNGTIIVYNADDSTEFCEIDTSVEVTRVRSQNVVIWNLFQRFPMLERLFSLIR